MRHEAATLPYPDALRRNALGVFPRFTTPRPAALGGPVSQELRGTIAVLDSARGGSVGSRRAARSSCYVSPQRARAERSGTIGQLRATLSAARSHVVGGGTLLEAVADGTAAGWQARLALQHALSFGENLADWDNAAGRTQAERLALVERVLAELGDEPTRRGGWSVSR